MALLFASLAAATLCAEKITFSANSMSGTIGDKSDSTSLTGEAYILTDSMEISADSISMSGKDFRYIDAEGSITGKNMESELEFTCGKMHYDRETKIAQLSDKVSLTDVKNNVKAKAQHIEYNQDTDIAVMQIDIELTQKDNVCKGAYAVYRKADQMLELSGNAQIKQGSDTFRAQEITLNLDSQEITLDGRVKGSVIDERKSSKTEEPADTPEADATENESADGTAPEASAEDSGNTGDRAAPTADENTDGMADKQAENKDAATATEEQPATTGKKAKKSKKGK